MRSRAGVVLRLIAMMCFTYALLRVAFLLTYYGEDHWSFFNISKIFYQGLRMDFAALFYINLPFLLYYFFIHPLLRVPWKKQVAVVLFSVINIPFLALNFLDLVYFRYNHRRTTVDLLDVLPDASTAFRSFFHEYWYVLLIFIVTALVLIKRVRQNIPAGNEKPFSLLRYSVFPIIFLGLCFLVARGFNKRPIQPSTPLLYADARYQPLVNNATFNFLFSVIRKQTSLEKKNYFTAPQLDSLFRIQHQYPHEAPFQKRNVVFFVLESFSKEFFKGEALEAHMPFFDSLMQHSTVYENAFANALESNKGLPAILSSLPDVMDEPVYLSNYSNIPLKGIGTILKQEGYHTSFFMGAEDDHFGFKKLAKSVGIDEYYSGDTYGKHKEQHDGTWGIYDEYFFRYFADVISKKQQPFFSVLFNLSSHSPYRIPEETSWIKVPGQRSEQNSITYVDYSFQKLFDRIRNEPWFNNTVFVFVADHGYRYTNEKNQVLREMRIPLFIYDPQQPVHVSDSRVVKQLDIVPSVLDKLQYSRPFTSFGTSFYRDGPFFSINRLNGVYHFIDSTNFLGYDEVHDKVSYAYKWKDDPRLTINIVDSNQVEISTRVRLLKAVLQRMNNSFVNNKLE